MDLTDRDGDASVPEIGVILHQQEAALAELENLLVGQRSVLVGSEPRELLENLQQVEQTLSKIAHLENERARWAKKAINNADGSPDTGIGAAFGVADSSASTRLLTSQQRVLKAIVRTAGCSEANRHLLVGLTKVTSAAIDRLVKLQESRGGKLSHPSRTHSVVNVSASVDIQA